MCVGTTHRASPHASASDPKLCYSPCLSVSHWESLLRAEDVSRDVSRSRLLSMRLNASSLCARDIICLSLRDRGGEVMRRRGDEATRRRGDEVMR